MPVYEYQCKTCHQAFEYQQRMSDPDKTECEACGGALERLISRTAFTLKGGGWYKDLYASAKPESKTPDAKADSGTAAAPASDAGSSTSSSSDSSSGSSGSGSSSSGSSSSSGGGGGSSTSAAASRAT